jgi:hypothetical protein
VMVILLIRKDRDETRKVVGRDVTEQERGCHAIIQACTGNHDGDQQAQRIDQEMPGGVSNELIYDLDSSSICKTINE